MSSVDPENTCTRHLPWTDANTLSPPVAFQPFCGQFLVLLLSMGQSTHPMHAHLALGQEYNQAAGKVEQGAWLKIPSAVHHSFSIDHLCCSGNRQGHRQAKAQETRLHCSKQADYMIRNFRIQVTFKKYSHSSIPQAARGLWMGV